VRIRSICLGILLTLVASHSAFSQDAQVPPQDSQAPQDSQDWRSQFSSVNQVRSANQFSSALLDVQGRGASLSAPVLGGLQMFEEPGALRGLAFGLGDEKLWRIGGGLDFRTAYDNNVKRSRSDRKDDVIFSYVPSIYLSRSGSRVNLTSTYGLEYEQFLDGTSDDSFNHFVQNQLSYKDPKLSASIDHEFTYADTRYNTEVNERRTTLTNRVNTEIGYTLSKKFSASITYENYVFWPDSDSR